MAQKFTKIELVSAVKNLELSQRKQSALENQAKLRSLMEAQRKSRLDEKPIQYYSSSPMSSRGTRASLRLFPH